MCQVFCIVYRSIMSENDSSIVELHFDYREIVLKRTPRNLYVLRQIVHCDPLNYGHIILVLIW